MNVPRPTALPQRLRVLLWHTRHRMTSERGQGTAEYALVLVAVASMVGVVIAFVSGDGGGMITDLFGAAFARLRSLVGG